MNINVVKRYLGWVTREKKPDDVTDTTYIKDLVMAILSPHATAALVGKSWNRGQCEHFLKCILHRDCILHHSMIGDSQSSAHANEGLAVKMACAPISYHTCIAALQDFWGDRDQTPWVRLETMSERIATAIPGIHQNVSSIRKQKGLGEETCMDLHLSKFELSDHQMCESEPMVMGQDEWLMRTYLISGNGIVVCVVVFQDEITLIDSHGRSILANGGDTDLYRGTPEVIRVVIEKLLGSNWTTTQVVPKVYHPDLLSDRGGLPPSVWASVGVLVTNQIKAILGSEVFVGDFSWPSSLILESRLVVENKLGGVLSDFTEWGGLILWNDESKIAAGVLVKSAGGVITCMKHSSWGNDIHQFTEEHWNYSGGSEKVVWTARVWSKK